MFRRVLLTVYIVSLLASFSAAQSKSAKLAWKFTKGEKYAVTMNQDIKQSVEIHETPLETSNSTTTYMTWTVDQVLEDGSADMTCVIDRVEMAVDIPNQGKVEIDTDKPGAGEGLATVSYTHLTLPTIYSV